MTVNKSVQTRRFNQLVKALSQAYDGLTVDQTASIRWSDEACLVAHDGDLGVTLWFESHDGSTECVELVKGFKASVTGLRGIHVREADLHSIQDAIDVALRDGFEKIYIHSLDRVS